MFPHCLPLPPPQPVLSQPDKSFHSGFFFYVPCWPRKLFLSSMTALYWPERQLVKPLPVLPSLSALTASTLAFRAVDCTLAHPSLGSACDRHPLSSTLAVCFIRSPWSSVAPPLPQSSGSSSSPSPYNPSAPPGFPLQLELSHPGILLVSPAMFPPWLLPPRTVLWACVLDILLGISPWLLPPSSP